MELILNGEPQSIDAGDCANLAELIARAELPGDSGAPSVVVSVEVDGHALEPEALSQLEVHALDEVKQVRIVRRPSLDVACSVLSQGAEYCVRITEAIAATSDDFRAGRDEQAHQQLAEILDSLSVLTGITYSISGVMAEAAQALATIQSEIHPWLEEMLEAQTGNDPIRIADALEYEIAPRIARWGETMAALAGASARSAVGR